MGETATITIDRMIKADLDQVLAIEQRSFSQPWSRNLFLSEFRNKPVSLMLVALGSGEGRDILGYIVCWIFVDELHVLDLAVREDSRRQGIARRLVVSALRTGYDWGVRKAFLEVRKSNNGAQKMYYELGFVSTLVRTRYYDLPVEDAVVMTLETERLRALLERTMP